MKLHLPSFFFPKRSAKPAVPPTSREYLQPSREKLAALKAKFDAKSWDETAEADKNAERAARA